LRLDSSESAVAEARRDPLEEISREAPATTPNRSRSPNLGRGRTQARVLFHDHVITLPLLFPLLPICTLCFLGRRRIQKRPKTVFFPGTEVVVMVDELGVAPRGLAPLENYVTRRGGVGGGGGFLVLGVDVFVWYEERSVVVGFV